MPRTARVATLFLRVTLADGKRPYLKPVLLTNKRLRPQYALVNGKAQHFPDGIYWLRYTLNGKATFARIGASAEQAMTRQREHEAGLAATAAGLITSKPGQDGEQERSVAATPEGTVSVETALKEWSTTLQRRQCTEKTIDAYLRDVREFQAVTGVKQVAAITRKAVAKYVDHLHGFAANTVGNRVASVRAFMYFAEKHYEKLTLPSPTKIFNRVDRPSVPDPNPEVYTIEELKALFAGCTKDERVLWEFFLETGFREQEVEFLTWNDLDLPVGRTGLARVREKTVTTPSGRKYEFRIKNRKGRVVPISEGLVERLNAFRQAHKDERRKLVFALPDGEPDGHMLRKLKANAFRLGLNCGECANEQKGKAKGELCENGAWCSHWQLHAFRRTIASAWHHDEKMPIDTVRALLGHSNLETTRHYLKRIGDVREETTVMASSAANRFR